MKKTDILALFKRFGADITADDVWQVQSATVIKHKALERLAASAKIEFSAPTIIRADRDEAVILVTGKLEDRCEWSIGEALVNVNYRVTGKMAAYVYAMAEKRAKDRVILKLAGLHGIYSEDEADEFQQGAKLRPEPDEPTMSAAAERALVVLRECATRPAIEAAWKEKSMLFARHTNDAEFKAITAEYERLREILPAEKEAA